MHYMRDYLQEKFVFTQMLIALNKLMLDIREEAANECVLISVGLRLCGNPWTFEK